MLLWPVWYNPYYAVQVRKVCCPNVQVFCENHYSVIYRMLASYILLMEHGPSKAVTGKEHLERNNFIIETQKAVLQRINAAKLQNV